MKKFYIILITIIVLFCIQFYWFGIRPMNIKKSCYTEKQESKETISALSISDERYEELIDRVYEDCVQRKGL